MELGKIQQLSIFRSTDFGFVLADESFNEVLLPNAFVTDDMNIGDQIEVFIYLDSEERLVATTEVPKAQVGEFAYLEIKAVNNIGGFADLGIAKQLLIPYAEQRVDLEVGRSYLIYVDIDEVSQRLYGSTKDKKFIETEIEDINEGDKVSVLLYHNTPLGMNCIINNKYKGLIFKSDIHRKIYPGNKIEAYIKRIREDGKIDLSLEPIGYRASIDHNVEIVWEALNENEGYLPLNDKSDPESIKIEIGLSKKAFKKAIGKLYKEKKISIENKGIKKL